MSYFHAVALSLISLFIVAPIPDADIKVDEAATQLRFKDGKTIVVFMINNANPKITEAELTLSIIDSTNFVESNIRQNVTIQPGSNKITVNMPPLKSPVDSFYNRLSYSIKPKDLDNEKHKPITGVISLSEISANYFDLFATVVTIAQPGTTINPFVQAINRKSKKPVPDIELEACIDYDSDDQTKNKPICAKARTDSNGGAIFNLIIPKRISDDQVGLIIKGKLDDLIQKTEQYIRIDNLNEILISTDKPLYQPGQQLNIRSLFFDSQKLALANKDAEIEIKGNDDKIVYETVVKTSEFGVAATNWPIPDNAKTGIYSINITLNDDETSSSTTKFKVSRYNIPTFKINIKSDKPYYLPEQNAEL